MKFKRPPFRRSFKLLEKFYSSPAYFPESRLLVGVMINNQIFLDSICSFLVRSLGVSDLIEPFIIYRFIKLLSLDFSNPVFESLPGDFLIFLLVPRILAFYLDSRGCVEKLYAARYFIHVLSPVSSASDVFSFNVLTVKLYFEFLVGIDDGHRNSRCLGSSVPFCWWDSYPSVTS